MGLRPTPCCCTIQAATPIMASAEAAHSVCRWFQARHKTWTGHQESSLHSAVHIGPKTQLGGVQDGLRMRLYLQLRELALAAGRNTLHDLSSCCWQSKLPPRHLKNGQACSSTAHQPFMSSFVSRDTAKPPAMGPAMLMACTRHRCLRIPKSRWHAQIAAASPGKWMEHYPCFLTAADVIRKLNAARIVCAKKTKRTDAAQRPRLIGQRY